MKREENTNELPTTTGTCKFCGQSRIIKTVGEVTQQEADEIATDECDCEEAKKHHNRECKIKKANEWAKLRFENTPNVLQIFSIAFRDVTNHDVESVTIKEGDWTHKVFLNSDGYLTVKSGKKVDEEVDFA